MRVEHWAAWAPGVEEGDAWRAWCRDPYELKSEGVPKAAFLPAMLRRRCGALARIMLTAADACCAEADRAQTSTVFASRHGNINESIDLLERIAHGQPLSPTKFSHTVHNAQAALFSIAAASPAASSSVAAQEDTFACGWIEALTMLARAPQQPVMLVVGDAALEEPFAPLVDEPAANYALALRLRATDAGDAITFAMEPAAPDATQRAAIPRWPDAFEFLRFLEGDAQRLELPAVATGTGQRFVWRRI